MAVFNEDTRVKIPATIQFMRNGYNYQSLKDIDLHNETRIAMNRFIPAISKLNGKQYTQAEALYYAYALKQYEGTNATKTGGSILQNVSQETLAGVSLCLPNENIVKLFNEQVNNILEKIHAVIDENQELASLRDFLLPMLMNGQIKIEDVKAS